MPSPVDPLEIQSDLTVHMKYARYLDQLNRRETWEELVNRNREMHKRRYPNMSEEIDRIYDDFVIPKKVLPSMRSLQFGGAPIEISPNRIYNCLAQETEFVTSEGVRSFADFGDGDRVRVLGHTGTWRDATVRSYGVQHLQKITLQRGNGKATRTVFATADHRWLLADGTVTTSLQEGDRLLPTPDIFSEFVYEDADPLERLYWAYGYVYGDGTCVKNGDGEYTYSMVRLCGKDADRYAERFEELGFKTSRSASLEGDVYAYTGTYLKTAPDPALDEPRLIRAFVRGYLDADGYMNPDWYEGSANVFKALQTSDSDHAVFVERCFPVAGVHVMNRFDLTGQETNYGVRGETTKYTLANSLGSSPAWTWRVTALEETDREETVWCLEVEDDHSFVLEGGIVTGNCAYGPVDDIAMFSETMFLLLGGTGVGYSVQRHHVEKLPSIKPPMQRRRYLIGDSIEGWADSVKVLMKAYLTHYPYRPDFDFSDIRPKGARLVTSGGKAPGPEPLKRALERIEDLLQTKRSGERLTPFEAHRIMCFIADAVLAGGIRRAAMISLFSMDDEEMLTAKSGDWWEAYPELARANNSVVLPRQTVTRAQFDELWATVEANRSGEPGFYWTNDVDWGTNPCAEIALRPFQFCNLCEINASTVEDQDDLEDRVRAAALIGTLQAGYTDFHYLRPVWRETTEEDALVGVGMTGIASGRVQPLDLEAAAVAVRFENARVARKISINPASRTTTVKPSGTSSMVLGTSSGIHAWHSEHYIRRIRVTKNESIYAYLDLMHPELLEDDQFDPNSAIISIPIKAPEGAVTREESSLQLFQRVMDFNERWIRAGHRFGTNTNNVSATLSIRDDEWALMGVLMWERRFDYNGLSVLPYDGGSYVQAPFESIDRHVYEDMVKNLRSVDITKVVELEDGTSLVGEAACAGGACEIDFSSLAKAPVFTPIGELVITEPMR